MGIDVTSDRRVVFNCTHDNLVSTSPDTNPTRYTVRGMHFLAVFRRVMSKSRQGDGNPLIYALKRKFGFKISDAEIKKLMPAFRTIFIKATHEFENGQFDYVLPMPSKHKISEILAKRVVRITGYGEVKRDLLRKKTRGEVLAEFKLAAIPKKHKKEAVAFRKALEIGDQLELFQIKEADNCLRPYIQPIALARDPERNNPSILLVDDLVSSGATFSSAIEALRTVYPESKIEGLCLLSPIKLKKI